MDEGVGGGAERWEGSAAVDARRVLLSEAGGGAGAQDALSSRAELAASSHDSTAVPSATLPPSTLPPSSPLLALAAPLLVPVTALTS